MKLKRAHVTGYRSIRDSSEFNIEPEKTMLIGPNEAGKTATLKALQALNPPAGEGVFQALRDFPRADYRDVQRGQVDPRTFTVVRGVFSVDEQLRAELAQINSSFGNVEEVEIGRRLDNSRWVKFEGMTRPVSWREIEKGVKQLRDSVKKTAPADFLSRLDSLTQPLEQSSMIEGDLAASLVQWIAEAVGHGADAKQEQLGRLNAVLGHDQAVGEVENLILSRTPTFVYFSDYYRVRPRVHLRQLAAAIDAGATDPEYDFGSICLLDLLGLGARELSDMGKVSDPAVSDIEGQRLAQDQLDERTYRLNAASVEMTEFVRRVWGDDDVDIDIRVDQDYLKVACRDRLGVEIELDQRSEGFQWLISFYAVFKSQASRGLSNTILLLDDPGVNLHALKQQEFRRTVSALAADNQTIYTTHSPFMVGTDELDKIRVIDMKSREVGTQVHNQLVADDPAALFPLRAALGYAMSESLFANKRNLVLKGITEFLYVQSIAETLRADGMDSLDEDIALLPAGDAGKLVYLSGLLQSQESMVAALVDSDQGTFQDQFVALMTPKRIHRIKDFYSGTVGSPEIEDLLRETLVSVAKEDRDWDVKSRASKETNRPIAEIFQSEIDDFSRYLLARRFVRWLTVNGASALRDHERAEWSQMFVAINRSLG